MDYTFIRKIHCPAHGEVVLGDAEYNAQMNNANAMWRCTKPGCFHTARFVGEFYECKCHTLIEMGIDVCPNCGFDHYEAYLESQPAID